MESRSSYTPGARSSSHHRSAQGSFGPRRSGGGFNRGGRGHAASGGRGLGRSTFGGARGGARSGGYGGYNAGRSSYASHPGSSSPTAPYAGARHSYSSNTYGNNNDGAVAPARPAFRPTFGSRPVYGSGSAGAGRRPAFGGRTGGFGARRGFGGGSGRGGFGGRGGDRKSRFANDRGVDVSRFVKTVADADFFDTTKQDAENAAANEAAKSTTAGTAAGIAAGTSATSAAPIHTAVHRFTDFTLDSRITQAIIRKGFTSPTPIQDSAIPHILKGLDVVGIANTGTGKTGAFLIPLIDKVLRARNAATAAERRNERILVTVPTRELAIQIEDELRSLTLMPAGTPGAAMNIQSVCVVGGSPINRQITALRRTPAPSFVIGTPGRIKDLIERKCLDLSTFSTLVLDEADRMLDMGFVHDIRHVVALMPKQRHTLFFSATLSSDIERLIKDFLNNPVRVSVKTQDTSKNVEQAIIHVHPGGGPEAKLDLLHDLLIKDGFTKVLVFGRTKHGVEKLAKMLTARGFKAESIHGNKTQSSRQRALTMFKGNHIQVLVATDVAARGLDISDITHVINYDAPATYEDYVHRIGRTGRGAKKGKALTFVG